MRVSRNDPHRPRIAVTLGDVAGIGPEVVVRACSDRRLRERCRPVVLGHPRVLRRVAERAGAELRIESVGAVRSEALPDEPNVLPCYNPAGDEAADVAPGRVDPRAGRAAYDSLVAAAQLALAGEVDAITTAPLNKAALHQAGRHYPGHTEILAEVCRTERFAMMLYLPPGRAVRSRYGLGVAHVTLHTSFRSVPELISPRSIRNTVQLVDDFLKSLGCAEPRIAVCALNPHAGEERAFGDEEARIITPGVTAARQAGIGVNGPLPADTLFRRAADGAFDGVVAMYHDQGHIALKLLGLERAVNVTLGLPIVRTSPSHGTAFDIAGTGRARADGMLEALWMAARLASRPDAGRQSAGGTRQ